MATMTILRKPFGTTLAACALLASVALAPYVTLALRGSAATPLTQDATAATWKPLVLRDLDAFRPPAPASAWAPAYQAGLWTLWRARARLTPEQARAAREVSARPLALGWNELLRERLSFHRHKNYPPRNARAYAILNVSVYDAMLAAYRAKAVHPRPGPAQVAPWLLGPQLGDGGQPSFVSAPAAASWAAATAFAHLIPEERATALARAEAETQALLWSGQAHPEDLSAGRALGIAIAEAVIAARQDDGAGAHAAIPAESDAPLPKERHGGLWTHPVPTEPTAGTWRTWLLERPDRFRLPEPPRPGSPAFQRDMDEVLAAKTTLTAPQRAAADRYALTAPSSDWSRQAIGAIERHRLSEMQAARVMAYWAMGQADAAIACWDSKYWWMQIRPQQEYRRAHPGQDWWPYLVTTPSHPSYPSGHCVFSGSGAAFLTAVFPDDRPLFEHLLLEMSNSRLWGGIHFRADLRDGQLLGRHVGEVHARAYQAELTSPAR